MRNLQAAPPSVLRTLASAVRTGQLQPPYLSFAIQRLVSCDEAVIETIQQAGLQLTSAAALADVLELAAAAAESAGQGRVPYELVWTGPEHPSARSRDTAVVVRELFSTAKRSLLVSGYAVFRGRKVLQALGANMDANSQLNVRLFLNVSRPPRDSRDDSELVREFANEFKRRHWLGRRLPVLYYDPRALVTSANLTGAAQYRNVEAGVLIDDPRFAVQLRRQFDALVAAQVRRVPGIAEGE